MAHHWRVATDERRTSDEWAVLVRGLLADVDATGITGISVCATVPAVLHEWRDMMARHFPQAHSVVVEPGVRTGVPVLMDNPREVGADRIINALAAATLYGGPAIVVDFGDRDDLRRGERRRPVHRRRHRPRHRDLAGGPRPPRAPSCARWSWPGPAR